MTATTKDCRAVSHYYADYYDGALALRDRAHVESHMRACASCYEDYRAYTGTCDLLHGLPKAEAPFGFADRVRFALRQEDAARAEREASFLGALRFPAWKVLAPATAAATLAAALLVVQTQQGVSPVGASADMASAASIGAPSPAPALEGLVPASAASSDSVQVAEKVAEIEALVEDINALTAQAEDPIFLGADNEYELVFNPDAVYRRPTQVGAQQASHSRP